MKIFLSITATVLLLAPILPAKAVGSCCIEIQENTDIVNSCAEQIGTSCPTGTTPIDCSLEPKCATFPKAEETPAPIETPTKAEYPIVVPKIPLNIPTVNLQDFINIKQEEGYIHIPFISVFLVGAYKFGVGMAAILAVIIIMAGGFIWIAAAGDSGKISRAKTMISSAVVGLLLTFGSYILLQLINPDLVSFKALKIPSLGMQTIEVFNDFNPEIETGEQFISTGSPSQYDSIFEKYAPCAGVTPAVLKAIAKAESGLNASKKNASGYIGLFQTKKENCPTVVRERYCNDLYNPDNNTAAGSAMIKKTVNLIKQRCPNAKAHDQMVMIYVSHNMGYYMLERVTRSGCDVNTMRQATINAYATVWPKTATSYSQKYQKACLSSGKTQAQCTGGPKFDYAVKTADRSGVTQVLAVTSGICPY